MARLRLLLVGVLGIALLSGLTILRANQSLAFAPLTGVAPTFISAPVRDQASLSRRQTNSPMQVGTNRHSQSSGPTVKKRKLGRDGVDHSHVGMTRDPEDGMMHAWAANHATAHECYGSRPMPSCIDDAAVQWFRDNVLMAIVTGSEGAFRVEVSQCTWLSHFPVENVIILSDLVPSSGKNRTPHEWVRGKLPPTVYEDNGDIFSPYVKDGYVRIVRKRGQGYSASWIVAQFRFAQAVEHMAAVANERRGRAHYKWYMIADDDTIVQLPNLVRRLQQIDESKPYYLSRKGWGGAGHVYSHAAFAKLEATLPKCVDKYFVRSFRASDDMLLKCAHMAALHCQMEDTMSHCPASHLGEDNLLSPRQATFHGKKDFYPPVLLTSWRVSLYYYAAYCKHADAAKAAVYYSACAFGSCKQSGCTKEKNEQMVQSWHRVSQNNTATVLPFEVVGLADFLLGR